MAINIPFTDPANEGSLEGVLKTVNNKLLQSLDKCLPAKIIKVDRAKNRVQVQPLITRLKTDGGTLSRAPIIDIPIVNISGGGFIINFPLQVGDLGWVFACDRDITLFKKSYSEAKPNTIRKHTFEDSIFLPDIINPVGINISDSSALVIQSCDGSTKIAMEKGKITIKADTIDFQTPNANFIGGTVKNDGVSIDKNHKHAQGSDSHGDAEQDTTPPIN